MKLVQGQLMHHRYRLDQRLAQGGMGEVWRGYDIELNRPVAIKALRSDLDDPDSNKLRRLRAEAHNSANLAHPNIAALFDYYEKDGVGFLVMEYVDSPSLAQLYKEKAPMPAVDLLPILIQVARGLFVAHSHGVIHRDVKPANIMVSPKTGEVKITDFGVSYSTNQAQITQDGMVVGTAQYISPEQAQGEQATPQSDIYSLGVVAYEGLCGHRPFTGKTPVDIAAAHVNEPVPPLPDTVDWRLREYVMGMLAKNPDDRPRSALDVSQNMQVILDHLWDEQTASIPPIKARREKEIGRRVSSQPYEPPLWMVDLTDREAMRRYKANGASGGVIDMHFDSPKPQPTAAVAPQPAHEDGKGGAAIQNAAANGASDGDNAPSTGGGVPTGAPASGNAPASGDAPGTTGSAAAAPSDPPTDPPAAVDPSSLDQHPVARPMASNLVSDGTAAAVSETSNLASFPIVRISGAAHEDSPAHSSAEGTRIQDVPSQHSPDAGAQSDTHDMNERSEKGTTTVVEQKDGAQ